MLLVNPLILSPARVGAFLFSPFAHRGRRVIETDTLRISLVSHVSSDGQEHEQDSEDNPNVNAHQSSPSSWQASEKTAHFMIYEHSDEMREVIEDPVARTGTQAAAGKAAVIGILHPTSSDTFADRLRAFRKSLARWRQELSGTIAQCLNLEHEIHHTASKLFILGFEPLK